MFFFVGSCALLLESFAKECFGSFVLREAHNTFMRKQWAQSCILYGVSKAEDSQANFQRVDKFGLPRRL